MKKTIQVNLSGQVFTLDEDAYKLLTQYLERIARLYDRSPGKEDIIQDIEARIAELFLEKLSDGKQVIDMADVKAVVTILGNPEEFEEEAAEEEGYTRRSGSNRALFRDPDNRVIGGVAAGVSHYFGIDPVWLRLALAIAVIFFGTGVILYIILWIIIPEASTAAEKLEMKGEPVNIGSIGKTIEDELNELGKTMKPGGKGDRAAKRVGGAIERLANALLNLIVLILRTLGKVLGVIFSSAGVIALIGLLAMILGVADAIHFGDHDWSVSYSIYELGHLFFESGLWYGLALVGATLIFFCPFILLTYAGLVLLLKDFRIPYLAGSLFGLWLIGLAICVFVGISTGHEFSKEESIVDEMPLEALGVNADTIRIELADDPFNISERRAYSANHDFLIKDEDHRIIIGNVDVFVRQSRDGVNRLTIDRSASGHSYFEAEERADSIRYHFQHDSNALRFNAYYSFPESSSFRGQEVSATVEVNEGTVVYLAPGSERVIYDIRNVHDMHDVRMIGHYWLMTSKGFVCTDCAGIPYPPADSTDSVNVDVQLDITVPEVNVNISATTGDVKKVKQTKDVSELPSTGTNKPSTPIVFPGTMRI